MLTLVQNDPLVTPGIFAPLLQEWGVPYRLVALDAGEALPAAEVCSRVIVLGGRMGAVDDAQYPFLGPLRGWMLALLERQVPLLGICLGGQLLAAATGGTVTANCRGERGLVEVALTAAGIRDPLFAGCARRFAAFAWHNDSFTPPSHATRLAASVTCSDQAFRYGSAWGLQFHPEVDAALVAAWSARDPFGPSRREAFAAVAVGHRALAARLLGNFLEV